MDNPLAGATTGTVNIFGHKVKRGYVVIGGLVVLVGGILWYRRKQAATAASSTGVTTDSAGNVGVIDPATGFVQGSPEDLSALEQMSGAAGSTGGGSSGGGGSDVTTQVGNGPPFTDNAAWTQYVSAYLVGTVGLDPGTVASDLGKYLAGAQVTQAERDQVIQPAVAYGDQPPIAGPNGFPPSINVVGSTSGTGSTPGAPTLSLGNVTATSGVVKWAPVSGATGYVWTATGPSYSKTGTTKTGVTATITGLKSGDTYTVSVHATNASGSGPTASITLTAGGSSGGGGGTTGGYDAVTVVEYHSTNPAWNSTISGIASHYGWGTDWESVWNDPRNTNLRNLRHTPSGIHAGDTVYVKRK